MKDKKVFSRTYYDKWAKTYESGLRLKFWFWKLLRRTWARMTFEDGASIYDLGCGTGNLLEYIHDHYPSTELYGTDVSEGMLEKARAKFAEEDWDVSLRCADMNDTIPWDDGSFDYVITTYCFHHARNPVAVLGEILRVLKPGGTLYFSDLCYPRGINWVVNKAYPRVLRWKGHLKFLGRRKVLRALNEAGFSSVSVERMSPYAVFAIASRPV